MSRIFYLHTGLKNLLQKVCAVLTISIWYNGTRVSGRNHVDFGTECVWFPHWNSTVSTGSYTNKFCDEKHELLRCLSPFRRSYVSSNSCFKDQGDERISNILQKANYTDNKSLYRVHGVSPFMGFHTLLLVGDSSKIIHSAEQFQNHNKWLTLI